MADILFRPICSNCHRIIDETVDYIHWEDNDRWEAEYPMHQIIPYKCKNCGSVFDSIEIPTKLPFHLSVDLSKEG